MMRYCLRYFLTAFLGMAVCLASAGVLAEPTDSPLIGAIRWEGWYENSKWANNLKPEEYHDRLPFYANMREGSFEVRSDNQETMDKEIMYASDAGLSYWAFCYDPCQFQDEGRRIGLPLYLSSEHKSRINFCVILLGHRRPWSETVDHLVSLFKEPTYQKVIGGRPLVYKYYVEKMSEQFGSAEAARKGLESLRTEAVCAGLRPPYIVAQVWNAQDGVDYVETLGFDAISAYSMCVDAQTFEKREYPYSRLAKINKDFWETCKGTGKEVIPIVNTGWDVRPRWWDDDLMKLYQGGHQPWFTQPTPSELASHLRDAIEWNRRNSKAAKANTVLIYAWNETDEGGWLHPTIAEGTARLDAIKDVLRKPVNSSVR